MADPPQPPPSAAPSQPHPLKIPDFRRLCTIRLAAELAASGSVVVLGYQLYDLARRVLGMSIGAASFQLGVLGLVQFLALFFVSPIAGLVADRFDRRRVVTLAALADVAAVGALAAASWAGVVSVPLLFVLAAAHGVVRAFFRPAMGAMTANVVPQALLPRAMAINFIAMQVGSISGPALAGILFAVRAPLPYIVATGLFAVAAVAAHGMAPGPPHAGRSNAHPWHQILEGFAYVRDERFLLGCVTLDLFAVLLGGATALLPAYARDIFHVGASGLGLMRAAPAAGAAAVASLLAVRPLSREVGTKMLWAVAVYGAATAVFGVSRWFVLSLAMLVVLGAADMVSVFIRNSLVQLHTPDDKRGRVSAISGLAISASNELGEMESGLAAALLGPVLAVATGGIAAMAITAIWAWAFPEIRAARQFSAKHEKPEAIQ